MKKIVAGEILGKGKYLEWKNIIREGRNIDGGILYEIIQVERNDAEW